MNHHAIIDVRCTDAGAAAETADFLMALCAKMVLQGPEVSGVLAVMTDCRSEPGDIAVLTFTRNELNAMIAVMVGAVQGLHIPGHDAVRSLLENLQSHFIEASERLEREAS